MKPYRIFHEPTQLYFSPGSGKNNLTSRGKVYTTANCCLNYFSGNTIPVDITKNSKAHKALEAAGFQPDLDSHWKYRYHLPKSQFIKQEVC